MTTYNFCYVEIVQNYKTIQIDLDDEDPHQVADSLSLLKDYIDWHEDGEITTEFDIQFVEVSNEKD